MYTNIDRPEQYEKILIDIMIDMDATLSDAMYMDMLNNGVDVKSVFDIVDYMELKLGNLDKVQYYMNVYSGILPDVGLKRNVLKDGWYKKYE